MTHRDSTPTDPLGQVLNNTATGKPVAPAFTIDHPLAQVAIDWHRNHDGEYGCNGITCPAVQSLISFGELCAWTWNASSDDECPSDCWCQTGIAE